MQEVAECIRGFRLDFVMMLVLCMKQQGLGRMIIREQLGSQLTFML